MTLPAGARPRVSVVVPTHQRADLLPRAMDSVLAQSFGDLELLVIDDGSTDATEQVVAAVEDPRVRYLRQEHAGANPARNLGARESTAPLLTFLDSDDEALPGWLAKLVAAMEEGVGIAFCGAERCRGDRPPEEVRNPVHLGPVWNDWVGLFNDGTFLLRREIFEAVGGYAEDLRASQHSELGFRVVDHCDEHGWRSARVDEPLVRYYVHAGDSIRKDAAAVLQGTEYILHHYPQRLRRHPGDYYDFLAIAGTQATRLGRLRLARSYFWRALRHRPDAKAFLRWLAACLRSLGKRSP